MHWNLIAIRWPNKGSFINHGRSGILLIFHHHWHESPSPGPKHARFSFNRKSIDKSTGLERSVCDFVIGHRCDTPLHYMPTILNMSSPPSKTHQTLNVNVNISRRQSDSFKLK
ncbi:uncharacterized protein LOC143909990 [Arctopsyche grandis]|uniref:uncharacterized protein LOC143909990 n=1 Tax=Arctopsyche grandis TaxID=121162 RepID=UPI00406D87AB